MGKEIKLFITADDSNSYRKNLKTYKTVQANTPGHKALGYEINTKKPMVYLYTYSEASDNERKQVLYSSIKKNKNEFNKTSTKPLL